MNLHLGALGRSPIIIWQSYSWNSNLAWLKLQPKQKQAWIRDQWCHHQDSSTFQCISDFFFVFFPSFKSFRSCQSCSSTWRVHSEALGYATPWEEPPSGFRRGCLTQLLCTAAPQMDEKWGRFRSKKRGQTIETASWSMARALQLLCYATF